MLIIGHRGARGLAPENTLASIRQALDCNVDEVEVDVRVTRDGVPVLWHDRSVLAASRPLFISGTTVAELKQHKPDLATLDQALHTVAGKATLHIEVKHGEPVQPVVELLKSFMRSHTGTAIVLGSKSQKVLRRLHHELPDVQKIVIEPWSGVRARYRAKQVNTRRISMRSWWLWKGFLRIMQRRGYQIVPYTLNSPKKVALWRPYIYGIVTDYPDRFSSGQAAVAPEIDQST